MKLRKKKVFVSNAHDFPPPPLQPQLHTAAPKVDRKNTALTVSVVVLLIAIASSGSFFAAWYVKPETRREVIRENQTLGVSDAPPSSVITPVTAKHGDPSDTTVITLQSEAELDGYVDSSGQVRTKSDIRVGRDDALVYRGFVSFDLSDLPAGSNVSQATLRLYEVDKSGTPSRLGALMVDHLTYGQSLEKDDYTVASILSNITDVQPENRTKWHNADVTFAVREDVYNARHLSQFRLHYENEVVSDGSDDVLHFESRNDSKRTSKPPQLLVEYY